MVITFNSDNSYTGVDYFEGTPQTETGTWNVSGNKITFTEDVTWIAEYSISDNKLTLIWTGEDEEEFPGEEVTFILEFTKQ